MPRARPHFAGYRRRVGADLHLGALAIDAAEQAQAVGRAAVRFALEGRNSVMPVIVRTSSSPYRWKIEAAPLSKDGETYLNLARVLHSEGRIPEAKQAARDAKAKGVKNPADADKIINLK